MERSASASQHLAAIPVRAAATGCTAAEPFALQVLGDAMAPEFEDGDVIVVEPDGLVRDGSFVIAQVAGEWTFRQLVRDGGQWFLAAMDPRCGSTAIPDLSAVRGVVIQKSKPWRRRAAKRYVD